MDMRCVKKQQDTKKNLDFVLYVEKRPAGRRQEGTGSDRRIEKEDSGEEEEEEVIISFEEDGREEKEHLKNWFLMSWEHVYELYIFGNNVFT